MSAPLYNVRIHPYSQPYEYTDANDSIVNNAGLGIADRTVRLHEQSEEHWEQMM